MLITEISEVQGNQTPLSLPFLITDAYQFESDIIVNNRCPMIIENVSSVYDVTNDVIIEDSYNNDIGVLCFLKDKELDIDSLTEYQFAALLVDVSNRSELELQTYRFKNNYAVIDENYVLNYILDYKQSAPLWGLYNHLMPISIPPPNRISTPKLKASKHKNFNNEKYYECSLRGIQQSYAFERYLKYYHLLELNFDYDVVMRIKSLDVNTQSKEIGKLLIEYEQDDISRLLHLFNTYCNDINSIIPLLNQVNSYPVISIDVFYTFGKTNSNPLKDEANFQRFISDPGGFSFTNCQAFLGRDRIKNQDDYKKFIGKLTMYWIYRVRCSIAHNKIGEYLMSINDEAFITNFAFPLLKEVTMQCFK